MTPVLAQILVFPVKSCAGISASRWPVDATGLRWDRTWTWVDDRGQFVTLRELPALARIATALERGQLLLKAQGHATLALPLEGCLAMRQTTATVWGDVCPGLDQGDLAARWVEGVVGECLRLVRIAPAGARAVPEAFAGPGSVTAFADAYPLLIVSEGSVSLAAQRSGLPSAEVILRTRPNLVFGGIEAHAEDTWRRAAVGSVEIDLVKPCSRCEVVDVDPATALRSKGFLASLSNYLRRDGKVWFGQNAVPRVQGWLAVGDPIRVEVERATATS